MIFRKQMLEKQMLQVFGVKPLSELEAIGGFLEEISGVFVFGAEERPSAELLLGFLLEFFSSGNLITHCALWGAKRRDGNVELKEKMEKNEEEKATPCTDANVLSIGPLTKRKAPDEDKPRRAIDRAASTIVGVAIADCGPPSQIVREGSRWKSSAAAYAVPSRGELRSSRFHRQSFHRQTGTARSPTRSAEDIAQPTIGTLSKVAMNTSSSHLHHQTPQVG
nr:hypothetical protein Iba_chr02cCG16730 [Ipomoea batatas]